MSGILKPCPCGKTPDKLELTDGQQGHKYHFATGNCCGEWIIEFRSDYNPIGSDQCMHLAIMAWNGTVRKPDEFLKVRQQLEAEWIALRDMQRSLKQHDAERVALLERIDKESLYLPEDTLTATLLRDIRKYLKGGA